MATYTYTKAGVIPSRLVREILASSISSSTLTDSPVNDDGTGSNNLTINFVGTLSGPDQTTLNGVVTAHPDNSSATPVTGDAVTIGSTVSGDLSGTLPSPTVAKVNGITPGAASGVATLNASSLVVQEPASKAQASGIASLNASSQVVQRLSYEGSVSGVATLDGSSLVVQNPTNATSTPTASKIVIANGSGKVDGWVTSGGSAATPSLRTLGTGATDACAGNDARLSDSRTPTAHAISHQNGGSDEIATATPGNNAIPKANAAGKLAAGWGGSASTLATLNASTKVVEDPANAQTTAAANKIPLGDGTTGQLDSSWGGKASGLATLSASSLVVQNPANATATPTASKIVIADGSGKVDGWVTSGAAAGTASLRTLGTGATDACAGNDSRLSDARTPTAHATSHKNGGSDEVATATAAANAIPKAGAGGTLDKAWVPNFVGDSGSGGSNGGVPAPAAGDGAAGKYLSAAGTWGVPAATSAVRTGAVLWVDKVNGNDASGTRGRLDLPYLTIQAAITAASSGDTVNVLPGTYNETITISAGVTVSGMDCCNCIIQRASAVTETVVTMGTNSSFSNFALRLNPSAGTTTGILFPAGTSNSTAFCREVNIISTPTGTGLVNAIVDQGTGTGDPKTWVTLLDCSFQGKDAASGATVAGLTKSGSGTSIYKHCTFDGSTGIGFSNSGGTSYLFGCRFTGTANGLVQTSGTPTIIANYTTSFSSRNVTSGNFISDVTFNVLDNLESVATPNVISDALSTPPGTNRESDAYIVGATPTGGWAAFAQGDLVVLNTAGTWVKLVTGSASAPLIGLTVIVTAFQGTAAGTFTGRSQQMATYDGSTWKFWTPQPGTEIIINGNGDPLEGARAIYKASTSAWEFIAKPRIVEVTGSVTSSTTTDIVNTGMTIAPANGTYEVWFTGYGGHSSATATTTFSIYVGTGANANGTRAGERAMLGPTNHRSTFSCLGLMTVTAVNTTITGQWKTTAATATSIWRQLMIRRIA